MRRAGLCDTVAFLGSFFFIILKGSMSFMEIDCSLNSFLTFIAAFYVSAPFILTLKTAATECQKHLDPSMNVFVPNSSRLQLLSLL